MNIPFLKSFYKKKRTHTQLLNTELLKKLEEALKDNDDFLTFENVTVYHHSENIFIPLIILEKSRGIYIFEQKEWIYDDLSNATITRASHQEPKNDTLSFEYTHDFIKQKYNELMHNDGVEIFNFLLMENLSSSEYKSLDLSLKESLPSDKILFNDSTADDILTKLLNIPPSKDKLPEEAKIIGNLLIQYLIIENDSLLHLATKEQIDFIDNNTQKHQVLYGDSASGKTSSILLKAIYRQILNPDEKIIILQPTTLACDILKKKLLNTIEHAIINLDVTAIEVITPIELVNKHLRKLNKKELEVILHIDTSLMRKKFDVADLIICDDLELYSYDFISYLKHIQKNASLVLVTCREDVESDFKFTKKFNHTKLILKQANQYAKALQIISTLLKTSSANEILVVSDNFTKKNLIDDLESFIDTKIIMLDASKNLIEQDLDALLLSSYAETSAIDVKYTISLDVCSASYIELRHAVGLAKKEAYVIYEEECENIHYLRSDYESN